MSAIILRDHKAFLKRHIERDEYSETEVESLAEYLQCTIDSVSNFTFGDLWRLIEKDGSFYEKVFKQAMGGYPLNPFNKDAEGETDDSELTAVEVYRYGEVWDYTEDKSKKRKDWGRTFEVYCDFHGIGPGDDGSGKIIPDMTWAIGFSPISSYMNVPLKLSETVEVRIVKTIGHKYERSQWSGGNMKFTVYDVLDTILDEITFYGSPLDRSATLADLDQKVQEVKDGIADIVPLKEESKDDNDNDE